MPKLNWQELISVMAINVSTPMEAMNASALRDSKSKEASAKVSSNSIGYAWFPVYITLSGVHTVGDTLGL